MLEKSSGLGE